MDFSWETICKRCRARLPAMYGVFLAECRATLVSGTLLVYVPDNATMSQLGNMRVETVLSEESGAGRVEFLNIDDPPSFDTSFDNTPPQGAEIAIDDPPPVSQSKPAPAVLAKPPREFKPITTIYDGYKFRSRLEARWAVFFHEAGIEYQYETDGFQGENGLYYLPDFYLPEFEVYVEVKGTDKALARDAAKIAGAINNHATPISDGLLILGEIPNYEKIGWGNLPIFQFLYYEKAYGIVADCAAFIPDLNPGGITLSTGFDEVLSCVFSYPTGTSNTPNIPQCVSVKAKWSKDDLQSYSDAQLAKIKLCYQKARQARFERGETGG